MLKWNADCSTDFHSLWILGILFQLLFNIILWQNMTIQDELNIILTSIKDI